MVAAAAAAMLAMAAQHQGWRLRRWQQQQRQDVADGDTASRLETAEVVVSAAHAVAGCWQWRRRVEVGDCGGGSTININLIMLELRHHAHTSLSRYFPPG